MSIWNALEDLSRRDRTLLLRASGLLALAQSEPSMDPSIKAKIEELQLDIDRLLDADHRFATAACAFDMRTYPTTTK